MREKTFVITVGNTLEPIRKSIEDIDPVNGINVVLVYGRPFPGQHPSPLEVANSIRQFAASKGLAVDTKELEDPEDIDLCFEVLRQVFKAHSDADEMVVNFTAGTKVMAAAAVHAALTAPFIGNLTFDYVGGRSRDQYGRVLDQAMSTRRSVCTVARELMGQTLNRLSQGYYEEARVLAERLPNEGKARFVRQAVEAFYLWDEFDYKGATRLLRSLYEASQVLLDDKEIGSLARTVSRFVPPGNRIEALVDFLRRIQETKQQPDLDKSCRERQFGKDMPLLVADILENSKRRYREGRPTESVLRSYRAIEVAVQGCLLLKHQINPWNPAWDKIEAETIENYRRLSGSDYLPGELALYNGFCLLRSLGLVLGEYSQRVLMDILRTRNHSYLEHGYSRVEQNAAERLNHAAMRICEEILACPLDDLRALVRHEF